MPLYWTRAKCRHRCDCGAVMLCPVTPDTCTIGAHWICDHCIDKQLDAYLSQLETELTTNRSQTREH